MELPLESLSSFRPATGTPEEWNAAYIRVEDYLRAHRVHNRLQQSRVLQEVLARAARRHARDPGSNPTTLAAEEIDRMMDDWFAALLGRRAPPHERVAIEGRVALLLCDGVERWPYAFLDSSRIPDEFAREMQQRSLQAGPDLAVSSMAPRAIKLGALTEVAGQTIERIERWPILRVTLLWLVFVALLTVVFRATR